MTEFLDAHANAISALGSLASAFVAGAALIVALFAAKLSRDLLEENRILRLSASDAEIISYLDFTGGSGTIFNLVIENVGNGPAFDVVISTDIDEKELTTRNAFYKNKFGDKPISAIAPGKSIKTLFGQGHLMIGRNPLPPFNIKSEYKNNKGKFFSRITQIDVRQFSAISKLTDSTDRDAIKALEGINRSLESLVSGSFLRVESYSPSDRSQMEENERLETERFYAENDINS